MFERFTERSRQIVVLAQDEAKAFKHPSIDTVHILLGILREEQGLGARSLERLGITYEGAKEWVRGDIGQGSTSWSGQVPFSGEGKKVLEGALREALTLGQNYIGTEHVLLGLLRLDSNDSVPRFFRERGISAENIRDTVVRVLSGKDEQQPLPDDLVAAARGVHEGLEKLVIGMQVQAAAVHLIEQGLKTIIGDLEQRALQKAAGQPDSPPPAEPEASP